MAEIDIEWERWGAATNDSGEILFYHEPCEVFFNYGLGPEGGSLVSMHMILPDLVRHEEECNGVEQHAVLDVELPGMIEVSDLSGGWADSENDQERLVP